MFRLNRTKAWTETETKCTRNYKTAWYIRAKQSNVFFPVKMNTEIVKVQKVSYEIVVICSFSFSWKQIWKQTWSRTRIFNVWNELNITATIPSLGKCRFNQYINKLTNFAGAVVRVERYFPIVTHVQLPQPGRRRFLASM